MKVTPLPFMPEMIRAIQCELAEPGTGKTQTRRVIKPKNGGTIIGPNDPQTHAVERCGGGKGFNAATSRCVPCPYGIPGDLIYVRESFAFGAGYDDMPPRDVPQESHIRRWFKADTNQRIIDGRGKWRPPMFMPRWVSRYTLRITDVRVQRVQDITNEDAVAEGIGTPRDIRYVAQDCFKPLWDSINADRGYSWESNPWVWAITFEPIAQNVDEVLKEAE